MNRPSVSIIVPVYNVEPYVESCIKSVMRQTYDGSMECIVVDDCGTDSSMGIVEKIIAEYYGPTKFIVLHHTHNRGLSAARNTGMDAATGDYLFFLDSDDELTDDCMEKLTEPIKKERYDVVIGNIKCFKMLSSGQRERMKSAQELKITDDILFYSPDILRTYRKIWGAAAWNRLYRIGFIRDNSFMFKEGLLHEDILWSFQVACLASTLYCVNHVTYVYLYKREGSIRYNETKQAIIDCLIIILKEMGVFVAKKHVKTADVFPFFNKFFYQVLNYHSTSLVNYVDTYKLVRPYIKISFKGMMQGNQYHLKKYLRDFHYFMPVCIAPYWHYWIYYRLRSIIKTIFYER